MRIQQDVRTAGRNQRMVEIPIATLPEFLVRLVAAKHAALHHGKLVMR